MKKLIVFMVFLCILNVSNAQSFRYMGKLVQVGQTVQQVTSILGKPGSVSIDSIGVNIGTDVGGLTQTTAVYDRSGFWVVITFKDNRVTSVDVKQKGRL